VSVYRGSLTYPNPTGKHLYLADSFCWTHAYNDPKALRYKYFYAECGGVTTTRHAGNDVHGRYGDRLVAAYPGVVRWVDLGSALGEHQFMVVNSNGYGFYYAHTQSRLKDKTKVTAGQLVAKLGDEGGVPPHLHFAIFRDWQDPRHTALDPRPALMKARRA